MRYMELGDDTNWLTQVRRGVAERCVLALLTKGERYGFELARELGERADHRWRRDALPAARPAAAQRPGRDVVARVDRRTSAPLLPPHGDGELALASFKKQWRGFRNAVDEILEEGNQE